VSVKTSPLARLRMGFIALGAALLATVGFLLGSALSRLDAQRGLRHQMVGDRVFDEIEQELGSVLQHEVERPAEAYDAVETDPTRWAPFVLGYYRREPALVMVAAERLSEARRARLATAIGRAAPALDGARAAPARPDDRDPELSATPRSSPDVLRQLNRSVKVRERRQRDLTQSLVVASADAGTLVIERRAAPGARREGFVVDVPELLATVEDWVLGAQGLGALAALSLGAPPPEAAPASTGLVLSHRLAPPLDSIHVTLRLSQLDDDDAQATLVSLAALLAAAAVLGLLALYRTVAVRVQFAERQGNFVSAVTHELKTPLTAIRMYGELLRDDLVADDATRRDYYATITAESERLSRLIDNVLEHGRLRRGERAMQPRGADLQQLVREVVELLKPHAAQQRFTIELLPDGGASLPEASVDTDAFKQVLFNVLDNALKYGHADGAREGERRIVIEHRAQASEVVVSVRDFGPGVPEPLLETVFEPFFRGQDELTRTQKGTGIGLSLVRDLVERMGGRVRALSRQPGLEIEISLRAA
jgi:signal transduction histidine kinase